MVRPNPRFDPVTGAVTTPTTPKEPRPNPRYDPQSYIFTNIDGYARNLELEKRLQQEVDEVNNKVIALGEFNPDEGYGLPSWWERVAQDLNQNPADTGSGYGFGYDTHQKALEYLQFSKRFHEAKINLFTYQCNYYPRTTVFCQHATQYKGILSGIIRLIPIIQKRINGFQFPEILPQVFAEEEPTTIISNGITEVTAPTPEPVTAPIPKPTINDSITDNMVTQKIDYFTIENGRALGQITFTATQNFNPFYYNKTITNLIQFKDRNGVNILPTVKQNNLRFTATERTETIRYDEGMKDNIYSKVSSFVWSSARTPTAFSKQSEFEIREKEPVKPISSGFMAAGVAGAIAGLILIGFIADHKGGK